MPARGHSTAPQFDETEPLSLNRFFQDLDTHFDRCKVTVDQTKKEWAVRYPSIRVADLWKLLESYTDVTATYEAFQKALRELYPGADDKKKYVLNDLDALLGARVRLGMHSATDLASYYRDFYVITKHLIETKRLSELEQDRAFHRGFPDGVWRQVSTLR